MPELEPITREEKFLNGEVGMTPITREEKILAGEDVETITRREYFLKKYRGGGGGDVTVVPLSITENGTYSEEGKAYSPVNVNVPLPENAYLLKSVTTPTPIASFTDGEEMVMPSLKVAIEPQQDLHGYDAPWAGGAGKNKANIADMNIQLQTTMGKLTLPSGTYVASATVKNNTSIGGAIKINTSSETLTVGEIPSASGTNRVFTASFTLSESTEIVVVVSGAVSGYNYDVSQVQIELGTTATSYAPYSNICPISGWSEANVTVADDVETPTVSNVYTIDLDGTRYGGEVDVVNGVLTVDRKYVDLGSLTWTTAGSGRHNTSISDGNFAPLNSDVAKAICSQYIVTSADNISNVDASFCYGVNGVATLQVNDSRYNGEDATAFKTHMNGVQLVYELATPLTIQLSPTAVKSLLGQNNVWADTGDIKNAEYFSKEV